MKKLLLSGVVVLAAVGLSCTEERTIIRSVETETVHLHGVLYGWMCGVGDPVNNPSNKDERRFGVWTGESATITLIRDNGFTSWFETDDSSRFDRYVSAGSYKVIIETGYTWPADTILNVHLTPGDTLLELDIAYDVNDPERISCYFRYDDESDTVGLRAELETMIGLSSAAKVTGIPGPLKLSRTMPTEQLVTYRHFLSLGPHSFWVIYDVPVVRQYDGYYECWNVIQAYEALQAQLDADTTGVFANLSVAPLGVYACLDGQ